MKKVKSNSRRHCKDDKPEIITLGCRLNTCESEIIRAHAVAAGLDSQTLILNTCGVTSEAVRQASQTIRRHRRTNSNAKIIVTGCAAQVEPLRFSKMPEVDYVIGNSEKLQANTFLDLANDEAKPIQVKDIMTVSETTGHIIENFASRTRAYVKIQNGCDHRCTFCIIPFGRGKSRSVPEKDILAQICHYVEAGYREVILTGVDITSYGNDLTELASLGSLVRKILNNVPELERLRLSSIDQIEVDRELLDCIANESRFMPHLHLSLQAGHDLILKRMKRRHRRDDAIRFCKHVRSLRPDIVFGADLIAGFPTETEQMFEATLDIIEACNLTYLHVFPFSPRTGTPAARMPQLDRQVIKQRSASLREKGANQLKNFLNSQQGLELDVLLENNNLGRTPHFAQVKVIQSIKQNIPPGTTIRMKIIDHDTKCLFAEQAL
ncbi:MAG: Threonylcarbamoyladenosine tRNA methylthiotransferase MtaB [Hyphomicrobiaceae bacterium hypho_1]